MNSGQLLDAAALLESVGSRIPESLRPNVVVIGSIATAWAFRRLLGSAAVATMDIDVLLRPAVAAAATAETLGQGLLEEGWQLRLMHGRQPGTHDTPDDDLPALRVEPPGEAGGWFIELLAMPPADQTERRRWTRFQTARGTFGLPSFRQMPIAIYAAEDTPFGMMVARPANMALAHLLEHADPDLTPVHNLPNQPPRFVKDLGRAVSLWWLANQASVLAREEWRAAWREALLANFPSGMGAGAPSARTGIVALADYVRDAHAIARLGVLAPHGTTLDAFTRAYEGLKQLAEEW